VNGVPPPGAIISARKMMDDPRAEPQYGERVPYVVKAGPPGARIVDRVVSPEELLKDGYRDFVYETNTRMRLDAEYYISKTLIPPLERIFNLVGANVRTWYEDMPKVRSRIQNEQLNVRDVGRRKNDATLHTFVRSRICPICEKMTKDDGQKVCYTCRNDPVGSIYTISSRSQTSETRLAQLQSICSDCCSIRFGDEVACDSRDCPVFYARLKATSALRDSLSLIRGAFEGIEYEW